MKHYLIVGGFVLAIYFDGVLGAYHPRVSLALLLGLMIAALVYYLAMTTSDDT